MKKVLLLLLVISLFSCSKKIYYREYVGIIDYSYYMNNGIFITESNSVSFEYVPVGSIVAEVSSGEANFKNRNSITSRWKDVDYKDVLDVISKKLVELKANGIINLQIKYIPATYKSGGSGMVLDIPDKIIASGMAIRK